jgi:transcriptional regulator with XRE-family HTH domain
MMCYITVVGGEAEGRYVKLDGAKVRWHRDQLGWTLDDVAEQAEVAKGTVLRAEHGEDVRPSSGRRIARAFGIDIPELSPEKPGVALSGKAEAPREAGPTLLDKALDAVRHDEEKDLHAQARLGASEGMMQPTFNYKEDKFRAVLRARGYQRKTSRASSGHS